MRELHRKGIHELWIQGTLDVVVNHFMMARGNRDVAELLLWGNGLGPELPRWIAANLYLRAEGLRRASLIRMSVLARQTDLTGEDLVVLDEAATRLARWGAETSPLSRREYIEMLVRLQARFGPDSADAGHPSLQTVIGAVLREVEHHASPEDGLIASVRRKSMRTGEADVSWGWMDILTPPLTHRCPRSVQPARRKLACGYTGAFRFPNRALLPAADGRAFGQRKRTAGLGTLLIDCSGSMSNEVTHDRLMALLAQCPSATVALYAGRPANQAGSLLIAARRGKHVAKEVIDNWQHAGNIVDGPALRWLSQQKPPRVWISDGEVTGLDDRSAENLSHEVESVTAVAHIRRVGSLDYCFKSKKQFEEKKYR